MHTGMRIVAALVVLLGVLLLLRVLGVPFLNSGGGRGAVQGLHIVLGIALAIMAPLAAPRLYEVAKRPAMTRWAWIGPWVPLIIGVLMLLGVLSVPTWVWIHAAAGLGAVALLELAGARRKPTD